MTTLDESPLQAHRYDDQSHLPAPYPEIIHRVFDRQLKPHASWPRCTARACYRQTKNETGERVYGVWSFSSDWLAEHLKAYPMEGMRLNPWDASLNKWLELRDPTDQRMSRLPDDWSIIGFCVAVYIRDGIFRPYCLGCSRNYVPAEIQSEKTGGRLGDQGVKLTCPAGHLLLQEVTMHLDRI